LSLIAGARGHRILAHGQTIIALAREGVARRIRLDAEP
jgi:hypothetical protein